MKIKTGLLAGVAAAMLTTMSAGAQQPGRPPMRRCRRCPSRPPAPASMSTASSTCGSRTSPSTTRRSAAAATSKGKEMAATKADYITYEMEHGPLDFKELREFMRGLVEAGPTRTGHKTPAVIVTLPISGTTDAVRANAWMIQQTLAAGVHGILLCNAESPEAARLMIEAARYPFAPHVEGLAQGTRGNGSQGYASTHVGRDGAGIHAHRRSVADEPGWRIAVRPEDRESAR